MEERSPSALLRILSDLEQACFAVPWTMEQIGDELGHVDSLRIFLDRHGNVQEFSPEPIAYCLMRVPRTDSGESEPAEIMRIAVVPEARRRGIARRLLAEAEKSALARAPEITRLLLEVSEVNAPALKLYAGAGYAVIHRRKGYYRDGSHALILEKRVARDSGK